MQYRSRIVVLCTIMLSTIGLWACGESANSPADNSQTEEGVWTVRGTLQDTSLQGGTAMALSHTGSVTKAPVKSNRSFDLRLDGGKNYSINFLKDGEFVAALFFQANQNSSRTTKTFHLPDLNQRTLDQRLSDDESSEADGGTEDDTEDRSSEQDSDIDLGHVEIDDGGTATPENSPTEQVDSDSDGASDFEETDDDDDGVEDELEQQRQVDTSELGLLIDSTDPSPGEDFEADEEELEIEFNQAIDPASVTETSFSVTTADAESHLEGTMQFDDRNRKIEFIPNKTLSVGQSYVMSVTTDITTTDGEALVRDFSIEFTVVAEDGHDERFAIEDIEPEHGEGDVDLDTDIEIKFTQPLDATTVKIGVNNFQIIDSSNATIEGNLEVDDDELAFEPASRLEPNTKYTIKVGTELQSRNRQSLKQSLEYAFQTTSETDEDPVEDVDDAESDDSNDDSQTDTEDSNEEDGSDSDEDEQEDKNEDSDESDEGGEDAESDDSEESNAPGTGN